jgi:transcription initiation factor TFIID subunit 13
MKESVAAASSGGASGRGPRKQVNHKGLFSKECEIVRPFMCYVFIHLQILVKNLMYGFGDDRNPGNDTVNVMEEILIEFIIDVVCFTA